MQEAQYAQGKKGEHVMQSLCNCSHKGCLARFLAAIVITAALTYFISTRFAHRIQGAVAHAISAPRCGLKTAMRKLWADHVIWTRDYIVAALAASAEKDPIAQRLLKNQEDIGNALIPYYGTDAAHQVTALLKQHILIAADLVEAARTNNTAKYTQEDKKWKENAAQIAQFLSKANSNWPEKDLDTMLNTHLSLTIDETKAHAAKKWDQDIAAFDKIFEQAMMMADTFTSGIVKQFPDKF